MVLLLGLIGCSSGPCTGLRELTSALGMVSAQDRRPMAAQGLAEMCELPEPVEAALGQVAFGVSGAERMADMKVAADAPELWAAACPGGPAALASSMQLADRDARISLHKACELERYGWSESAFAGGRGAVVLPIVLAHLLAGERAIDRSVALDALAGI